MISNIYKTGDADISITGYFRGFAREFGEHLQPDKTRRKLEASYYGTARCSGVSGHLIVLIIDPKNFADSPNFLYPTWMKPFKSNLNLG